MYCTVKYLNKLTYIYKEKCRGENSMLRGEVFVCLGVLYPQALEILTLSLSLLDWTKPAPLLFYSV